MKLVEKPQPVTMAPHDFCNIKGNVKVASTENGIIFGNIGKFLYIDFLKFYWYLLIRIRTFARLIFKILITF